MWVAKRFDLSWSDLAFAGARCLRAADRAAAEARVEAAFSATGEALACLSVRSAFDLLLEACAFPPGSDVVFSAMTVGDMPRIARERGLTPIGCDFAAGTAAPGVEELERACTPTTRVVVLAHLFGSRMDVAPLVEFCGARGILVVEDCAQAYAGPEYAGHPASDVALFSFGPIKHATALGGGVAVVRSPEVRDRMREIQLGWEEQPRSEYLKRVIKYAGLYALSLRSTYTAIAAVARATGVDVDGVTNRLTRGFPGPQFFRRIRRRPCAPLLETMARRLEEDVERLRLQETRVQRLLADSGAGPLCPGADAAPHSFWLLPVLASDSESLLAELRSHGFDATRGRSFTVVGEDAAPAAARVHRQAVYVPVYPAMPDAEVARLASVLRAALA